MARRKERKSVDDWVRAAFAALADGGVAAVKVERLARQIGVTKGSFYWHFADRAALLLAMLAWWETFGTQQIITHVTAIAQTPVDRLRALARTTIKDSSDYDHVEAALRSWAANDAAAQAVIERIDTTRLSYVRDLLLELGLPPETASARAQLVYRVMIGEYTWRSHGGAALDDTAIEELVRLATRAD